VVALCLLCTGTAWAQETAIKITRTLTLGETTVRINVYEKKGAAITFFSPHHNEREARIAAREAVERNGGRFVELESFDEQGAPARRLRFQFRGKSYSLDPNRIFTENGRRCAGFAPEAAPSIESFARALLDLVLASGGERLREGERFLVAIHNNMDVDSRNARDRAGDLTASAFVRDAGARSCARGAFHEQAAGVYLSNAEDDEDNFVILSTPRLVGFFASEGFNVVVQKAAAALRVESCGVDDGSLSVYAALRDIHYVCLEADAQSGGPRQRQMIEALYKLLRIRPEQEAAPA
jgi:hypothetical protein